MDENHYEVVKWYTRARRFPQLIGRTPDGTKIPGGPYTFTQVLGAAAFLILAWKALPLWGVFGLVGNAMVMLVATWLLIVGLGRIPINARNPLSLAEGALRALTAPAAGRVDGREVRIRRPHAARTVLVLSQPQPVLAGNPTAAAAPDAHATVGPALTPRPTRAAMPPATPPAPEPATPAPTSHRPVPAPAPLTSVQQILAGLGPRKET